ncbi:MAG: hypothetical protein NTV22_06480 [bacterium]|nr:hypothetical protein [bacterium]
MDYAPPALILDISDITPPNWISGWPAVALPTLTGFTVRAEIDEPGAAFYVVLADGAAAPSAAQVRAGQDATGGVALSTGTIALAAASEGTAVVGNLFAVTPYDVYFVAEDRASNLQATPVKVDAATIPEPAGLALLLLCSLRLKGCRLLGVPPTAGLKGFRF